MTSSIPCIWIVDDDPDDQLIIQQAFKILAPQLTTELLSGGEELLACIQQANPLPSLVLLDLNMARKNGFETLAELRSEADYHNVPVVVLTTSNAEADRKKSLQLGANDFLTKPLSFHEFSRLLGQLLVDWQLQEYR